MNHKYTITKEKWGDSSTKENKDLTENVFGAMNRVVIFQSVAN
jgi:hypothetical protein